MRRTIGACTSTKATSGGSTSASTSATRSMANSEFSRPVVVLRKYNQYSFLALPLTTNAKPSKWRVAIGAVAGRVAFAVLSQLRNIDSRRLIEKKGHVDAELLTHLKKAASLMNFG